MLLTITRSSTDVVITWTNTAIGWLLEQSTNLVSPIAWSPNTNAILNTNGNFNVIVPAGEGNRFYHLKK